VTVVTDRLVWIDCEMTGLDLGSDLLIEVAALVTDSELNVLGDGVDIVIGATAEQLSRMPDVVRDMHASSGLTDAVLASTVTVREAEEKVLAYIREWVPEARKAPLCGNSIGTDRRFLAAHLPEIENYLHYRSIDVSTLKELALRWAPEVLEGAPKKESTHRALDDIRESLNELRWYRTHLFRDFGDRPVASMEAPAPPPATPASPQG
jgi:oligoribonuclease